LSITNRPSAEKAAAGADIPALLGVSFGTYGKKARGALKFRKHKGAEKHVRATTYALASAGAAS